MNALIIYDTNFGNTRKLAEEIAKELGKGAKAVHVDEITTDSFSGLDLLVVGSPIIAWNPSPKIKKFLKKLRKQDLGGIKGASFDTRINIKIHGDACEKISKQLQGVGLQLASDPVYFFVADKEGPLEDGEIERALGWAAQLKKLV